MWRYLIKRLLLILPTLWLISVLAFMISHKVGVSPVLGQCGSILTQRNLTAFRSCQQQKIKRFHLDKPPFYFAIQALAEPDTLYTILDARERDALEYLLHQHGNWANVQQWRKLQKRFLRRSLSLNPNADSLNAEARELRVGRVKTLRRRVNDLHYYGDLGHLSQIMTGIDSLCQLDSIFAPLFEERSQLSFQLETLSQSESRWRLYVPSFQWYGFDNQYHAWLSNVLRRGDFGYSMNNSNISDKIGSLFYYTAILALLGSVLILLIGVPMGVLAAQNKDGWWDRLSAIIVFAFKAIPEFWLGLVLLMFFANPDYLNWFDSVFVPSNPTPWKLVSRYILPLIAYSYGSLAVVSRTVRSNMLEQLNSDYVRTARAKGLSYKRVVYRHALRNALIPLISIFSGLLPAMVGGALIL
ncbi:MAG: ABC transporter permease, partial [Bacteroidota bacterium]